MKKYLFSISPLRGPPPVLMISTNEFDDVTYEILSYLGPQYDWHGSKYSPNKLGYEKLNFELSNGTQVTFEKDEIIPSMSQ
jgi:hypothetical protein